MGLDNTLDDLTSDVSNVSLEHSIIQDNLLNQNKEQSKFNISLSSLDKPTIDKFNKLYEQVSVKRIVTKLEKVDYNIAQEVFTMLPDVSKSDQAKVTSQPSYINKELMEKVLSDVSDVIPEDSVNLLKSVVSQIETNRDNIELVYTTIDRITKETSIKISQLKENKPIIIADRRSIDLLTAPFNNITYIDDSTIDYKKYSGKLVDKFNKLAEDPTLKTFINYDNLDKDNVIYTYDISLLSLHEAICNASARLSCSISTLERGNQDVENILKSENIRIDENSYDVMNKINSMISSLEYFKMLFDIIDNPDNFLEKFQDLVFFID